MNIFRLSLRNMTSRPLSTTLSLVLLTLGVGMIALLLQVNRHIQQQMENNIRGIDMVVGAKGSPLQLILSAVYHIDAPTGNIALHEAEQLQNNRLVAYGIPLSYGDSYEGYRIVGTDHQYPELYAATLAEGQLWQAPFEVTVGATTANLLNLKIGDNFVGAHGLTEGGEVHDEHAYQVVGVFDYTNSVLDQLILTATESVWAAHHHEEEHEGEEHGHGEEEERHEHQEGEEHHEHEEEHKHEEGEEHHEHDGEHEHDEHEEEREITAMLVKFRSPMGIVQLPRRVNEDTNMQAAVPAYEISRLFSLMGVGVDTLSTIALVIMAVSGLSVFISLYNALKDRQYEMALMRTYGASRWQLVGLVLQEGLLLTLVGFLLGILVSRLGLWLISGLMEASYHYSFSGWGWLVEEWWLLVSALAIGLLASLLPAIRVFRINISKTLADA
ncbi:ABC transporter permease [Tunicatimonas pelagia]|uniref:ABC transporter permease n=1 Tax=Tunicatimonas pelagia TaxID=931531 RepID=UPI002665C901|nr:ABC transporter permease [Tunicatimonas pelagia]WKN44177.1 ABC transporter permease [Tunicatimonas pelagia]